MNSIQTANYDDDMPDEIDFSNGVRGKFFNPHAQLNIPVYLDLEIQIYLGEIAARKGIPLSDLANVLLKREIEIIEAVK